MLVGSAVCLRGLSHSPVSPFGIVAHPDAMDSLLVAYGGAALLILVLQVIELYWISCGSCLGPALCGLFQLESSASLCSSFGGGVAV